MKANGVAVEPVELEGNRGHLDGVLAIKQAEAAIAAFVTKSSGVCRSLRIRRPLSAGVGRTR